MDQPSDLVQPLLSDTEKIQGIVTADAAMDRLDLFLNVVFGLLGLLSGNDVSSPAKQQVLVVTEGRVFHLRPDRFTGKQKVVATYSRRDLRTREVRLPARRSVGGLILSLRGAPDMVLRMPGASSDDLHAAAALFGATR
jgi:hypothetical protein